MLARLYLLFDTNKNVAKLDPLWHRALLILYGFIGTASTSTTDISLIVAQQCTKLFTDREISALGKPPRSTLLTDPYINQVGNRPVLIGEI